MATSGAAGAAEIFFRPSDSLWSGDFSYQNSAPFHVINSSYRLRVTLTPPPSIINVQKAHWWQGQSVETDEIICMKNGKLNQNSSLVKVLRQLEEVGQFWIFSLKIVCQLCQISGPQKPHFSITEYVNRPSLVQLLTPPSSSDVSWELRHRSTRRTIATSSTDHTMRTNFRKFSICSSKSLCSARTVKTRKPNS